MERYFVDLAGAIQDGILLCAGVDFVWNATNLSREIRTQVVDLLAAYEARIRIVYVEASHDVFFERNPSIDRMMDRWEVPDPAGAQQVEWRAW